MRLEPPLGLAVISIHAELAEAVIQWHNWSFYQVSSKMFKLLQLRLWPMLKRTFHLLNMPMFLSVWTFALSADLFIQTHMTGRWRPHHEVMNAEERCSEGKTTAFLPHWGRLIRLKWRRTGICLCFSLTQFISQPMSTDGVWNIFLINQTKRKKNCL